MVDIYVLDGDLNRIGIIDYYTSLIWANRYNEVGDCEIYVQATNEALNLLRRGYYLSKPDDDMVCRIETVELDTDTENGNYLIVKGYDVKKILFQRIVWSTMNVDGYVEDFLREMVYKSLQTPNLYGRQIKNASGRANFFLADKKNYTDVTTLQVSYANVGEKIEEVCKERGWGYRVLVDIGNFYFDIYKGTDRSSSVIFSEDFENLRTTTYTEDSSHLGNVALVAGEGEGSKRSRNVSNFADGLDRYEIYVDARDISKTITYGELKETYPLAASGGQGYLEGTAYKLGYYNVPIVDSDQLTQLKINYPGGVELTIQGNLYYQIYDATIADLSSVPTGVASDDNSIECILRPLIYEIYLLRRGYEKLAEYGTVVTFEGTVEPDVTFKYKEDYFLGDQVTVRNNYGIEVTARIVEVIETYDENGYNIEPKFEYLEVN